MEVHPIQTIKTCWQANLHMLLSLRGHCNQEKIHETTYKSLHALNSIQASLEC